MPVQLPQPLRLQRHKRSRDSFRDGERRRIHLPKRAALARHRLGLVLAGEVDVRAVAGEEVVRAGNVALADVGLQDVRVDGGQVLEDGGVDAEVLGDDVPGRVREPVVDHEGRADLVEVAVVEDEQVLVLVVQALHRVRRALGEVPHVADGEDRGRVPAVFVDGGHEDAAGVDPAPFGLGDVLAGRCRFVSVGSVVGRWWYLRRGASAARE